MREIKFRAWDIINRKMYKCAGFLSGQVIIIEDDGKVLGKNDEGFILMQFTGLKDKNGKEIYEGDILKWKCSTTYTKDKVKLRIVTIQWGHWPTSHGYDLTIYENGNKYATGKSYWNDEDREVIGNIYENPEFVAGTQKGLDLEG
jgi:uncharacterized phage protein (TIGR01671 family)